MARDPALGIRLTSNKRVVCVMFREGKQTRNAQPQLDSGANSSIDRVDGVIFSDLESPMTPHNWFSNRYLVNLIDH